MTLIFDWLSREGIYILSWWLLATAAGIAALPWGWRLLGGLPDKGYTLARPLGLMLVGFVYWFLGSIGLLQNTPGAIVAAWLIVLLVGVWLYRRGEPLPQGYWRETASVRVVVEVLFIGLFVGWAIFRAHQNDTGSTEKPMELAFMSGILRSSTFPPNDPWLSGYAISYYYFGYVMSAMLTMISGVKIGIGFSLTISMWFALTGTAAFGVAYNMVRSRAFRNGALWDDAARRTGAIGAGVLALVCVILLSNFQFPLIEIPYQSQSMPEDYFQWWRTQERADFQGTYTQTNPTGSITDPASWDNWWFFRASRVLTDIELDGRPVPDWYAQPIDEFPNFSFLLSDTHPHVLALPFVILCLGMALSLVLLPRGPNVAETLLYGLMGGVLIFLNTWDGPVYLTVLAGAFLLRRIISKDGRLTWRDWASAIGFEVVLLAIGVAAVLPFLIGFRSQAGGFLPTLIYPTYFPHFFLMFGPFILMTGAFVLIEGWRGWSSGRMNWSFGLLAAGGLLAVLGLLVLMFIGLASAIPSLRVSVQSFVDTNGGWDVVMSRLFERRLVYGGTILLLLTAIVIIVARLVPRPAPHKHDDVVTDPYSPATGFALLLIGMAVLMALIPEFVYLKDVFSTRINTIFKFYYQVWVLLSIATGYGIWCVFAEREERSTPAVLKALYSAVVVAVFGLGLLYPLFGVYARAIVETGRLNPITAETPLTLDGTPRMVSGADEYAMVMCLADLVRGQDVVVAEASRDAYRSYYNRVGSITGIPTVIGWENHERQWRGPTFDDTAGGRAAAVEALYNAGDIEFARGIIDQYGIDYIVYGQTERQTYEAVGEEKFIENYPVVCEVGDSRVYRVVPLPNSEGLEE